MERSQIGSGCMDLIVAQASIVLTAPYRCDSLFECLLPVTCAALRQNESGQARPGNPLESRFSVAQ